MKPGSTKDGRFCCLAIPTMLFLSTGTFVLGNRLEGTGTVKTSWRERPTGVRNYLEAIRKDHSTTTEESDGKCYEQKSRPWIPKAEIAKQCILKCVRKNFSKKSLQSELMKECLGDERNCPAILWRNKKVKKTCRLCVYEELTKTVRADGKEVRVRRNLDDITHIELHNLIYAYKRLQADNSTNGYQHMCVMHSLPGMCPYPTANETKVCSIHGETRFLMWHRLITLQFEDSLRKYVPGFTIPYWEWTKPMPRLLNLARGSLLYDPVEGECVPNPFYRAYIAYKGEHTIREPDERIFQEPLERGMGTILYEKVLSALEQENIVDFDTQFEDPHNNIHQGIGGMNGTFSDTDLAAYEPLFSLHHSYIDKIWIMWQYLQEYRQNKIALPMCMHNAMYKIPLLPYNFNSTYNPNPVTHANAYPHLTLDYTKFMYSYENFEFGGETIAELSEKLDMIKRTERIYVAMMKKSYGRPSRVQLRLCRNMGLGLEDCEYNLGYTTSLGGGSFGKRSTTHHLYLHDITRRVRSLGLKSPHDFHVKADVYIADEKVRRHIHKPLVINRSADGRSTIHVSWDDHHEPYPEMVISEGARVQFHDKDTHFEPIRQLYSLHDFQTCNLKDSTPISPISSVDASSHIGDMYFVSSHPLKCSAGKRFHLKVVHPDQNLTEFIPDTQKMEHANAVMINWGYSVIKFEYKPICIEPDKLLIFRWCGPHHNAIHLPVLKMYQNCSFGKLSSEARLSKDGILKEQFKRYSAAKLGIGRHYFACTISRHCEYGGMRIIVDVKETCSEL